MRRRVNRKQEMQARFTRAKRRNMLDAAPGLHDCILVLDGLKPDFNIGKIFRSGDAFGVREIHLIGVEFFDPEPAKGSVRWVRFFQHEHFDDCYRSLADGGYHWFALEPASGHVLGRQDLPRHSVFVFGHEEFGLSFRRADYPDIAPLTIPQWGHVQSLNVSVAASIVLFEYVRQHGRPASEGLPQIPAAVTTRTKKKHG